MTRSSRSGKIITFYSYKGGTGRTMALANLAWVLASNEQKVLIIDWDLLVLKPTSISETVFYSNWNCKICNGLIDFVWDLSAEKMTPIEAFFRMGRAIT